MYSQKLTFLTDLDATAEHPESNQLTGEGPSGARKRRVARALAVRYITDRGSQGSGRGANSPDTHWRGREDPLIREGPKDRVGPSFVRAHRSQEIGFESSGFRSIVYDLQARCGH